MSDRVRCAEWVRKLCGISTNNLEDCKVRNDYIQYLKITLRSGLLHGIFMHLPPEGDLKPLSEHLVILKDQAKNIAFNSISFVK